MTSFAPRLSLAAKKQKYPSDMNKNAPLSVVSMRISWARLLKRVFDINIVHCPYCGAALKIIAVLLKKAATTNIPDHLGLSHGRHPEHLCPSLIRSSLSESQLGFFTSLHD
ncbi:hypothetical protein [Nitrosomonas communis]|uniref:hypothetical protein n=1 Tax=Nitrosomonas communis TaxID=44574 RepID=UPI003D2DADBD